jgi:hypothetical protein
MSVGFRVFGIVFEVFEFVLVFRVFGFSGQLSGSHDAAAGNFAACRIADDTGVT